MIQVYNFIANFGYLLKQDATERINILKMQQNISNPQSKTTVGE